MSRRSEEILERLKFGDLKEFEESRIQYAKRFDQRSWSAFKRKITQGFYWTSIDKDLANQVLRDERWFLGIKFWDAIKIIDHGSGEVKSGVGFTKTK